MEKYRLLITAEPYVLVKYDLHLINNVNYASPSTIRWMLQDGIDLSIYDGYTRIPNSVFWEPTDGVTPPSDCWRCVSFERSITSRADELSGRIDNLEDADGVLIAPIEESVADARTDLDALSHRVFGVGVDGLEEGLVLEARVDTLESTIDDEDKGILALADSVADIDIDVITLTGHTDSMANAVFGVNSDEIKPMVPCLLDRTGIIDTNLSNLAISLGKLATNVLGKSLSDVSLDDPTVADNMQTLLSVYTSLGEGLTDLVDAVNRLESKLKLLPVLDSTRTIVRARTVEKHFDNDAFMTHEVLGIAINHPAAQYIDVSAAHASDRDMMNVPFIDPNNGTEITHLEFTTRGTWTMIYVRAIDDHMLANYATFGVAVVSEERIGYVSNKATTSDATEHGPRGFRFEMKLDTGHCKLYLYHAKRDKLAFEVAVEDSQWPYSGSYTWASTSIDAIMKMNASDSHVDEDTYLVMKTFNVD
jgi:hypothetical protein